PGLGYVAAAPTPEPVSMVKWCAILGARLRVEARWWARSQKYAMGSTMIAMARSTTPLRLRLLRQLPASKPEACAREEYPSAWDSQDTSAGRPRIIKQTKHAVTGSTTTAMEARTRAAFPSAARPTLGSIRETIQPRTTLRKCSFAVMERAR